MTCRNHDKPRPKSDKDEFTLLSLAGCPACAGARKLLQRLGLPFQSKYPDRETLRQIMHAGPRAQVTYPQIFHGQRHVGGYDSLIQYLGLARQRGISVKPACGGQHGCH